MPLEKRWPNIGAGAGEVKNWRAARDAPGLACAVTRGLIAATLHRGRNMERIPLLGDGPPRDLNTVATQYIDDSIIGQNVGNGFIVDKHLDAVPNSLG